VLYADSFSVAIDTLRSRLRTSAKLRKFVNVRFADSHRWSPCAQLTGDRGARRRSTRTWALQEARFNAGPNSPPILELMLEPIKRVVSYEMFLKGPAMPPLLGAQ